MSWETVLQSFSVMLAGVGGWFLYDLVREFKSFKTETSRDIVSLKFEREAFKNTIKATELQIASEVFKVKAVQETYTKDVGLALTKVERTVTNIHNKASNFEAFLQKSLVLSRTLDTKIKNQEKEIQSIKIRLGELIMFKSKNGK